MNPLVAMLQAHGWRIVVNGAMGTGLTSPDGSDSLFIHPMTTGMSRDTFPVEIVHEADRQDPCPNTNWVTSIAHELGVTA